MDGSTEELDARIGRLPEELAALDAADAPEDAGETVGSRGPVLPIGYYSPDGSVSRDFELVTWDWGIEERLGEIAEREPEMHIYAYISELVGAGVKRLGDFEFAKLSRGRRRLLVSQMYQADVFYLYVSIRIAGLGENISFPAFKCAGCGKPHAFVGDLRTLAVEARDERPPAEVEVPAFA